MKLVKKGKKGIIWVLIYTKAKEEKKANENLQRQGFKTFLPLIAATNKNSESESLVPVFPRYFFAQINLELDNWTAINSSYGVSHIVMFSEKFTSIPNNIIKLIQCYIVLKDAALLNQFYAYASDIDNDDLDNLPAGAKKYILQILDKGQNSAKLSAALQM